MKPAFSEGVDVQYKNCVGKIDFISENYITICIHMGNYRVNDVCILVYKEEWNQVKLMKESDK